jgi:predicted dehydrogenase
MEAAGAKAYGVGILGNCCTHGAGLVGAFAGHPRTRVVAGYEPDGTRGEELAVAMARPLAESYEAVAADPAVDILCVTTDPCDKATMVELACAAGKPIHLNKPMCESLDSARRIVRAVAESGVACVHDIPMVKGVPVFARLRQAVEEGAYGEPVAYAHSFGMTFPLDFPIRDLWPERFDPPGLSGGGEMTNMGCYALDFMVTLWGSPRTVQAKRLAFWQEYAESPVENFGQIVCDYGRFFATLAVGKQKLTPPHGGTMNHMCVQFEHENLMLDGETAGVIINGVVRPTDEFIAGLAMEGSIDQLLRCVETGAEPYDTVEQGRAGIEVLMAAYRSIVEGGRAVELPLADGRNPLVA